MRRRLILRDYLGAVLGRERPANRTRHRVGLLTNPAGISPPSGRLGVSSLVKIMAPVTPYNGEAR